MQTTTWTAILVTTLFSTSAVAKDTPQSPEAYCWEQQAAFIDEGLEMPTGPIQTSGERWTIVWENGTEDSVPGDEISVPFKDGTEYVSGHTPATANHLLALNRHWAAGREPFAVRYEGTVYMIVPYWNNEAQEAWCASLPLAS